MSYSINILGLKFGKLTAIKKLESVLMDKKGGKKFKWLFKCDCGSEYEAIGTLVKNGRIKSCGCDINRKDKNGNWKGFDNISGSVLGHYKKNAKKRNIEFNVDIEYLNEIYIKQNKRCPYTNIELIMERKDTYCRTTINASLDRMDSKKGYIKGNIQWVYTPINNMKGSLDDNTFTELCGIIYKNSFLNKKEIHEPLSVDFLKKQKNCCGNGCIHCPFNWINVKDKAKRDKLINDSKSKDSSV